MRLVVVGSGYVGLVSGACLAACGHAVICVDRDASKIATLQNGGLPIFEPGLADIVATACAGGHLSFSTELKQSVQHADAVFIAVGTPPRPGDGHADLSNVFAVAREIADELPSGAAVIVKSTVPVGTGDEIERIIRQKRPRLNFSVVSNPEFLRSGAAVHDFQQPDRIVIGLSGTRARDLMTRIYRPLRLSSGKILYTTRRSAELIKYASNALLATKIAFINEVATLCERVDADVQEVAKGIGLDPRIGGRFLEPGPGFGGSCFPKDALALAKMGEDFSAPMRIIEAVLASNESRKQAMAQIITDALGGSLRGKTVGMLGLTFKPNTDDMREAPSIAVTKALVGLGIGVRAFDPAGMKQARSVLPPEVVFCGSPYDAAREVDAVVVMTEWGQFRSLNLMHLKAVMAQPLVVDLRNIFDRTEMRALGFRYIGIGGGGTSDDHEAAPGGLPETALSSAEDTQRNGELRPRLSLVSDANPLLLGSEGR